MFDSVAFGHRINELRKSKEISFQELSDKIGISQGYLKNICSGVSTSPTLDVIHDLAAALDTSIDQLLIDSLEVYQSIEGKTRQDTELLKKFRAADLSSNEATLQFLTVLDVYKAQILTDRIQDEIAEPLQTMAGYEPEILAEIKEVSQEKQFDILRIIQLIKKH